MRDNGFRISTTFPKKGWFPHGAVHFIIEKQLNLATGFWGHIAAENAPEEVVTLTKHGGHASASRAERAADSIVELIQVERIIECFEAELWGQPAAVATTIIEISPLPL